jgi:hypothetical protein
VEGDGATLFLKCWRTDGVERFQNQKIPPIFGFASFEKKFGTASLLSEQVGALLSLPSARASVTLPSGDAAQLQSSSDPTTPPSSLLRSPSSLQYISPSLSMLSPSPMNFLPRAPLDLSPLRPDLHLPPPNPPPPPVDLTPPPLETRNLCSVARVNPSCSAVPPCSAVPLG